MQKDYEDPDFSIAQQSMAIEVNDNEDSDSGNEMGYNISNINEPIQIYDNNQIQEDFQNAIVYKNDYQSNNEEVQKIIDMFINYLNKDTQDFLKKEKEWISISSEYIKGLFYEIEDVYDHCLTLKHINLDELLYGLTLWLRVELEKLKEQKQYNQQQDKDKKKSSVIKLPNEVLRKMNSIIKLIRHFQLNQKNLNFQVPPKIIEFYLELTYQLNHPNLFLTIFYCIREQEQQFDIQINYIISKYLIQLNQLHEAEYIVNTMLLLYDGDKQIESSNQLYVYLAFKCYSDINAIQSLYQEFESKLKIESFESKFKLLLSYCQSLRRLGEPQKLRDVLYLLGQGDQMVVLNLFSKHTLELYELLVYTNRLPYVAKVIFQEQIKENTIDEYPNEKTKNYIELLNKACIQNIQNGAIEFKFIYQIIKLGQDYPKLMQEAKEHYLPDIIKELDDIQSNKEYFIQKEHQLLSKYVTNWVTDIINSDQNIILNSISINQDKLKNISIFEIINTINILKMSGQYKVAEQAIDTVIEDIFYDYQEEFQFFSQTEVLSVILKNSITIPNIQQLAKAEYFDYISIILSKKQIPLKSDKPKYQEMKQKHADIIKQQLKQSEFSIFQDLQLTKATCLLYQKQYQEGLITVQKMMLTIIFNEGQYSYSLLPFLNLQAELATYQNQKTLATLSRLMIKKIMNEEESFESTDLSFLS